MVLDLYTIDVMERLSALRDTLPRLGWPQVRAVITSSMKWTYESPDRMNAPAFVERVATSRHAMGAAKLAEMRDAVVMLRSSLLRDFGKKGVDPDPQLHVGMSTWTDSRTCSVFVTASRSRSREPHRAKGNRGFPTVKNWPSLVLHKTEPRVTFCA